MEDYHSWFNILAFIIIVLINATVFGFGTSIKNIGESDLERDMEEGDKKAARLLRIINRPTKFVNTVQLISVLFSYIIGDLILDSCEDEYKIPVYVLALLVHLSFGIVIPKYLARNKSKEFALFAYPIVNFFMFIFSPAVWIINMISRSVLKIFSVNSYTETDNVTEEDIMSMVNEGHEQGILESREAMMITNIFELNDKTAADVMTNRKNLVCLDAESTLSDTVDFMLNEGINSRYPVYSEDIDHILGVINMKDAFIYIRKPGKRNKSLSEIKGLIRRVQFVPETKNLDELFKEMQTNKLHLVVVIDEYAQTQGIVTLEDILEEIVGNILDEYDVEEEENIIDNGDGSYTVNGICSLDEFSKTLNFEFDEEDIEEFDTINGFIINKLGRLPVDDDDFSIKYKKMIFTCLKAENKFIEALKVNVDTDYDETESEEDE